MLLTPSLILNKKDEQQVVLRKSGILGQSVYIVPRSQCSFRRVGLVNKGRNAKKAVLLRLKKEALSTDGYFKIVPDKMGGRAGAWEFPKSSPNPGLRYLPESLARQPLKDGGRLVECIEGFEGQIWYEGNLIASRWWPVPPQKNEWLSFARAVEAEVDIGITVVPSIEKVAYRRDIPIWDVSRERMEQLFSPKTFLIAGMTTLSCFAVHASAQLIHHWSEIKSHTQTIENVSAETEAVISQRNRAIRNIKSARRFDGLGHKGSVIIALHQITEVIKGQGLKLSWVRYIDGNVEIGVATTPAEDEVPIKIPTLVADMESKSALTNVSMSVRNENLLTINAQVDLGSTRQESLRAGQ